MEQWIVRDPQLVLRFVFTDEKWFTTELRQAKTTILKPDEKVPCKLGVNHQQSAWLGDGSGDGRAKNRNVLFFGLNFVLCCMS